MEDTFDREILLNSLIQQSGKKGESLLALKIKIKSSFFEKKKLIRTLFKIGVYMFFLLICEKN